MCIRDRVYTGFLALPGKLYQKNELTQDYDTEYKLCLLYTSGNRIWDALDHNRTYMIILDMYLTMLSVILGGILNIDVYKRQVSKHMKY